MSELATKIEDRGARWQISLCLGDDEVSGLGVVKKRMQIGSVAVKMGGIAGVWTDEKHRKKGYASQAMWESIALMEREKYDMSILFGIADFYHRYGYAVAFADQSMWIETSQLLSMKGALKVRKARKADYEAIRQLYRRCQAGRSGADARLKGWIPRWRMPRMGEGTVRRDGTVLVVCDAQKRVCGYAVYDAQAGRTVVTEVCGKDRKALLALGQATGRRAKREGAESVRFQLPDDDPFVLMCVPLGCTCSTFYPPNSGSMGRIICLDRLMKKLLPVFTKRWAMARPDWVGALTLDTDIGRVGVEIGKSRIELVDGGRRNAISMSQMTLTQLVMGYRSAESIAFDDGVHIPQKLIPVLDVLFPQGKPYMWSSDRF